MVPSCDIEDEDCSCGNEYEDCCPGGTCNDPYHLVCVTDEAEDMDPMSLFMSPKCITCGNEGAPICESTPPYSSAQLVWCTLVRFQVDVDALSLQAAVHVHSACQLFHVACFLPAGVNIFVLQLPSPELSLDILYIGVFCPCLTTTCRPHSSLGFLGTDMEQYA